MNGNRIPDYDIADIVPEYTGFTQDVKTQQQKQDSQEKAKGGCSVSLISPSLSFETAAKSAFSSSPLRKFPVNYNCKMSNGNDQSKTHPAGRGGASAIGPQRMPHPLALLQECDGGAGRQMSFVMAVYSRS